MIVEPYVKTPAALTVAILTPEGVAVSEHGQILDLDDWPAGTRLWASYETVYGLVRAGKGEALCWNHEEIRWRHRRFEEGWSKRSSDAAVVKLPFDQLGVEQALAAFVRWRDWLEGFGASPTGTSGSAAWSLLRARLRRKLFTGSGERPPLDRTVGGRQQMGPAGQGRFEGRLVHLDLPAAYASTLAGLRYGGQWLESPWVVAERYAGSDHPVFVRARVRVPAGLLGPLVSRQKRKPRSFMESMLLGQAYPSGRVIQGVWTWEEVAAAELAGCRIVKVLQAWVHRSGHHPFWPWWEAIEEGRRMPGLAGQLAKVTGNALWGRFCMDSSAGVRSIRSKNGVLSARPMVGGSQTWPAHDLAETVSGRVRAKLYGLMVEAGDSLVSAHTDGAWIKEEDDGKGQDRGQRSVSQERREPGEQHELSPEVRRDAKRCGDHGRQARRSTPGGKGRTQGEGGGARQIARDPGTTSRVFSLVDGARGQRQPCTDPFSERTSSGGWRVSAHARRLDLLDPQTLRYWPDPAAPWEPAVVYAGVPAERAGEMFEARWQPA